MADHAAAAKRGRPCAPSREWDTPRSRLLIAPEPLPQHPSDHSSRGESQRIAWGHNAGMTPCKNCRTQTLSCLRPPPATKIPQGPFPGGHLSHTTPVPPHQFCFCSALQLLTSLSPAERSPFNGLGHGFFVPLSSKQAWPSNPGDKTEGCPCARHWAKAFTELISLNAHKILKRYILHSPPTYRKED